MVETKEWDKLLRYLKTTVNGFIDIPTGTLHAIGKGVLTYNISRNADLTLRLYDYDRIDIKKDPFNQKKYMRMRIFQIK